MKRSLLRLLTLGAVFLHPLLFLHLYFEGNWYSIGHDYSLGILFGVIAYCYMATSLLLASRVRFLDRLFGQDKVIRFHGYLASIAITLGITHFFFKRLYIGDPTVQTVVGATALILTILLFNMTLAIMINRFVIPFPFNKQIKTFTKKIGIDYNHGKMMHNGFALVLLLLIIHVLLAQSTGAQNSRMIGVGLWGGLAILRYINFITRYRVPWGAHRAVVESVESLTDSVVRIEMKLTGTKKLSHHAGQFVYLRFLDTAISSQEHPFTLSSGESGNPTVTVKNLGNFTSELTNLKPGDKVSIDGPYGKFTPLQNDRHKLFIAGGIGITPFLSILSTWEETNRSTPVTLLWSVMEKKDLFDLTFLESLEQNCDWFQLELFVTLGEVEPYHQGFIDQSALESVLPDGAAPEAYLCGPPVMTDALVTSLRKSGVPSKDIHLEKFSF